MSNPAKKLTNQTLYQVLSLDVVTGALSVGLFAIVFLGVTPDPVWWLVLALAVWTVYTLDHLVDGYKKKGKSSIYRHYFHYRFRKLLIPLVVISGLTSIILTLSYLGPFIVVKGSILTLIVLIYFILVLYREKLKINYLHKEFIIASIYVTGILLAPLHWYESNLDLHQLLIFAVLALLAWCESTMVSYFDYEHDKADDLKSFTQVFGPTATSFLLKLILVSVTFVLLLFALTSPNRMLVIAFLTELIMSLVLLSLLLFPGFFSVSNRFRWVGETVFILPGFIFLF